MKNLYKLILIGLLIFLNKMNYGQYVNGGMEDHIFTPGVWTRLTGYHGQKLSMMMPTPNRHYIKTSSLYSPPIQWKDIYTGIPQVASGDYSIQLGESNNNDGVNFQNSLGYTFTVPVNDPIFRFKYAVTFLAGISPAPGMGPIVLHTPTNGPSFSYYMVTGTKKDQSIADKTTFSAISNSSYYSDAELALNDPDYIKKPHVVHNTWLIIHTNWICQEIDLSSLAGQQVTIWLTTSNCASGQHFAYAYLDDLGHKPFTDFSLPQNGCNSNFSPIWLDMPSEQAGASSVLDMYECNDDKTPKIGGDHVTEYFNFRAIGKIDLRDWYTNKNHKKLKCNTKYNVTIKTTDICEGTQQVSKVLNITCPEANAGLDRINCCNTNNTFPILAIESSSYNQYNQYYWYDNTSLISQKPKTTINSPTNSSTYTLEVKDTNGCSAYDFVDILQLNRIEASIKVSSSKNLLCGLSTCNNKSVMQPSDCGLYLTASISNIDNCNSQKESNYLNHKIENLTYLWSTGETTPTISVKSGIKKYSVVISSLCSQTTLTIDNVISADYFKNSFPALYSANECFPGDQSKWFRIYEYGISSTDIAYKSYRYKLTIYDKKGKKILRCIENCNAQGFQNGSIFWDGKDANGKTLKKGEYKYTVTLWNCSTSGEGQSNLSWMRIKEICDKKKFNWKKLRWEYFQCHIETTPDFSQMETVTIK